MVIRVELEGLNDVLHLTVKLPKRFFFNQTLLEISFFIMYENCFRYIKQRTMCFEDGLLSLFKFIVSFVC